jgi:hypothetical protein
VGKIVPQKRLLGTGIAQIDVRMCVQIANTAQDTVLKFSSTLEASEAVSKTTSEKLGGVGRKRPRPFVPFTVVLTFIVLVLVFITAHGKVADPDIWWHLHNADYLIQHHNLPRYDMYSFTVSGHPWINHEWLSDLPYYLAWRVFGLRGIDALAVTLLCLIYLGVLYLSYRECGNYKSAVLATACAIFLGRVSFGPRTILFGYAFLVVLLVILQRFKQRGHAPLWLIPPLFCLWINTHGSWSLGMIFFSIIIAGGLFTFKWGMVESELWTSAQRKSLLLTWGASIVLLFANPYGARLVFYPLDLAFHQKTNIEHVAEWVSINFHDFRGKMVIALLIVLFLSTVLRPRRWTLTELAITVFALYSGLTYVRFLFLTGVVLAPVLAKMLDFVPLYRADLDTPVLNTFAILLMIAGVVHYWPSESKLQATVDSQYPVGAITYLHAHPPGGPIVNYYLWGGYINWKDPNLKVFVDGRADIFDYSGVFTDYLGLLGLERPDAVLDKYKAQYVLFPHGEPFTYLMEHDSKWKTIYSDQNSVLLERGNDAAGGGESRK